MVENCLHTTFNTQHLYFEFILRGQRALCCQTAVRGYDNEGCGSLCVAAVLRKVRLHMCYLASDVFHRKNTRKSNKEEKTFSLSKGLTLVWCDEGPEFDSNMCTLYGVCLHVCLVSPRVLWLTPTV